MFRSCDYLFDLLAHFDVDYVGFASFCGDDSYSSVIASMGHTFVN